MWRVFLSIAELILLVGDSLHVLLGSCNANFGTWVATVVGLHCFSEPVSCLILQNLCDSLVDSPTGVLSEEFLGIAEPYLFIGES